MKRIGKYLNPITRLGIKKYSIIFPLTVSLLTAFFSEFVASVLNDPNIVGVYIVFINIIFIIYFAFRDGIRGGTIITVMSLLYYAYLIDARGYRGQELVT
ncbi:MAG: hypothetical protein AAB553_07870, partial [Patescibacteria group bacterium]